MEYIGKIFIFSMLSVVVILLGGFIIFLIYAFTMPTGYRSYILVGMFLAVIALSNVLAKLVQL